MIYLLNYEPRGGVEATRELIAAAGDRTLSMVPSCTTPKLAVASGQSDDTSSNKSLHRMTVPASNTAEVEVCVEPGADGKIYNPPAKRGDCLGRLERNVTPPGHKIYRVPAFFLCIATLLGFGPSVVARAIHGVWYMNVWLRDWYNPRLMLLELHALTGLASLALMCIQVGRERPRRREK